MVQKIVRKTTFATLIGLDKCVWAGFALSINAPCGLHCNIRNALRGWVRITTFGNFAGC
jgi:hypothetical protein